MCSEQTRKFPTRDHLTRCGYEDGGDCHGFNQMNENLAIYSVLHNFAFADHSHFGHLPVVVTANVPVASRLSDSASCATPRAGPEDPHYLPDGAPADGTHCCCPCFCIYIGELCAHGGNCCLTSRCSKFATSCGSDVSRFLLRSRCTRFLSCQTLAGRDVRRLRAKCSSLTSVRDSST